MIDFEIATVARDDIHETLLYYGTASSRADRFSRDLAENIDHLQQWPRTGHRRRDLTPHDVCFWTFDDYYIVFRLRPNLLSIVAVLHASRNVARILRGRFRKSPLLT